MKVKTKDLIGVALDWAVAKCEGDDLVALGIQHQQYATHFPEFSPTRYWAQGGPIISREKVAAEWDAADLKWKVRDLRTGITYTAATPLVASMRCYVASKLGEEVEIPEELK